MINALFPLLLALVCLPLLLVAYRILPRERWQILAAIPLGKEKEEGRWRGCNVTYYGFFLATGAVVGVIFFFLLLASIGTPLPAIFLLSAVIMFCATLAAKVVAKVVEKKKNTFTVAGGATTGLLLTPLLVEGMKILPGAGGMGHVRPLSVMAALAVGYLFGEAIGRLACISFGCCYGKPLHELGPFLKRVLSPLACVYEGTTKKIAYASGLAGKPVVPIQAISSFLLFVAGLAGLALFTAGLHAVSFAFCLVFSMLWRFVSEQWRADYRGGGAISAYQVMSLVNIVVAVMLILGEGPAASISADLWRGMAALWNPAVLLFLQLLWLALFLYTGTSRVTRSHLDFFVVREQV